MEKLLNFFARVSLAMLILAMFVLAQVSDPSGRWTATLQRDDRTGVATINLKADGTHVTGTLSEPSGQTLQIENGTLEGGQLNFDCSAQEHGGTKRIHFFGQVTNDAITLHNQSNGKEGVTVTFHRVND